MILWLVFRLRGGGYPHYILTKAASLNDDNESIKNKFFPLYDKILNYWFPPTEGYDICPKWNIPNCERTDDFSISFVVEHDEHPLLLIEIKPPSDFQFESGRQVAISQVIARLDEIGPANLHTERLYAISAVGKRWRACYVLSGSGGESGQSVGGVAVTNSLQSPSPDCWNPDITSDASWAALQSIVQTIKGYVAQ